MIANIASAAFLRSMARVCRIAAKNRMPGTVAQRFDALAADLERKAAKVDREAHNGGA